MFYFFSSSDEPEVLTFNRNVLPAYYGLLRLCCEHSPSFTRQLSTHSTMKWAFENLTTRMNQYPQVLISLEEIWCRVRGGRGEWGSHITHMKGEGMLVVSLRGVNFGFWSHFLSSVGRTGQNAIIFRHKGPRPDWPPFWFYFKLFYEHPCPFYIGVSLPPTPAPVIWCWSFLGPKGWTISFPKFKTNSNFIL